MRILFSSNVYPTKQYSLQAYVGVLCEELTRQGHEVVVIAPQLILSCLKHNIKLVPRHYFVDVETNKGIKQIEIFRPHVYSIGASRLMRYEYWAIEHAVTGVAKKTNGKFDIIYCQFWSSVRNILSFAEKTNIPVFVDCGEDVIWPNTFVNDSIKERIKSCTKGVVCVSSKNRDECISLDLASKNECIILPNAVNPFEFYIIDKTEARRKLGFPEDAFIVSFCGRYNHRKGVKRVAEAIKKCGNVNSIFIGRPSEDYHYEPDCPGILFNGALAHEDIVTYLNASDIYILPTLAEGCSNSIIEAMACGLPVVSSDLPFNYDVLDETNSILIDPMNVQEISDAIVRLKDDKLRNQMAQASLEKVKNMTIEYRAKSIINFIGSKI